MGPMLQDSANGARAPQNETTQATADANGKKADQAFSFRSMRSLASPAEARLNERLARVLGQKRGPDAVIVSVLCVALFFGLIGLAVHFLWIVAIVVMALGLGYTVANSRRDHIDAVNHRAEGQPDSGTPRL
jgi:Flp pilus assembly protein TadB